MSDARPLEVLVATEVLTGCLFRGVQLAALRALAALELAA